MNPKLLTLFSVVVALAAGGFVRSALGEPEGTSPSEARPAERVDDNAAAPTLDPKLLARVIELEAARRAARKEALADPKSWQENRVQRADAHRVQQANLWGSIVGSIDGQARLRMHAERMSRLNRILDLAELRKDPALVARVRADIERELTR
ncbi:MAG TPA: hypothetical protein VJV79_39195, partial [Polyangiaceae bacterium]|nr:hypothetical protein [Polyangiaceae bacterium]